MSDKAIRFWFFSWVTVKLINNLLTRAIGVAILLVLLGIEGASWEQAMIMFCGGAVLTVIYLALVVCYVFSKKGADREAATKFFYWLIKHIKYGSDSYGSDS